MTEACAMIGIDWGSTRLRAFRIGADGQLLERRANECGVNVIRDGNFEQAFEAIIDGWPSRLPILMCGMVGSRHGWYETAYQPCPAQAGDLASALSPIETRYGPAWIVAGLCSQDTAGVSANRGVPRAPDVMRGEETLMIGAASDGGHGVFITPGTHSKWAVMRGSRIEGFRTYMTGEIYALLTTHSSLARLMSFARAVDIDEPSFLDGVHLGLREPALLHSLFSVRTDALFGQRPATLLPSLLSGILIGSEIGAERQRGVLTATVVSVIAGTRLGRLYETALTVAGCRAVQRIDSDLAVVRGLWRIWDLRESVP